MSSFSDMKKNRRAGFEKLQQKLTEKPSNRYTDERFWKPTPDKAGNANATIRFLPSAPDEDFPFVQLFNHNFRGSNGFYNEYCLTTIGKPDPVVEYNKSVFDAGLEDQGKNQARKLKYISNIYVVDDPGNPENNGKVFLYSYGKKIYEMINAHMFPEDEDEEGFNPFDLWEGANFRLKMKTVVVGDNKFPNYDMSKFAKPGPLADDDKELEAIWRQQYKLAPFIDPENTEMYKPYETLKARLIDVVGAHAAAFFGVGGGTATTKPAPTESAPAGKVAPAKAAKVDEDDSTLSLGSLDDEDDDLPFDLDDDDDDLESFQDLTN